MLNNSIQILGQIIAILLGFFSTYIIFDFMKRFKRNIYHKRYVYILAYIIFTAILFISNIFFTGTINLILSLLGTVIIGHFLYNNEKIYILYYSIYVMVLFSFQIIVSVVFNIACYYFNINFYNIDIYGITLSIITQFTYLSVSRFFIICFKNKNIKRITKIQYLNFFVLPLFSIIYISTLMMYIQTYMSIEDLILLLINILSIVVLNLFITNIFESISKNNELKNKIMLYEEQSKMQYEYYNSLESKYRSSRKTIHDIKNHLQTIEDLYRTNEYEKGKEYTKDMYLLLEKFSQKKYTNNKVLNVIINDKFLKAKDYNIEFICKIGNVNLDFIKDIDLTTIFANLLDNAIDETKEIKDSKNITLKIDKFNEFIVINLINSLNSKPIKGKKFFKTTKKDHKGFGLENVSITLEKYEGNMRINYDEDKFKVNIIIPINN